MIPDIPGKGGPDLLGPCRRAGGLAGVPAGPPEDLAEEPLLPFPPPIPYPPILRRDGPFDDGLPQPRRDRVPGGVRMIMGKGARPQVIESAERPISKAPVILPLLPQVLPEGARLRLARSVEGQTGSISPGCRIPAISREYNDPIFRELSRPARRSRPTCRTQRRTPGDYDPDGARIHEGLEFGSPLPKLRHLIEERARGATLRGGAMEGRAEHLRREPPTEGEVWDPPPPRSDWRSSNCTRKIRQGPTLPGPSISTITGSRRVVFPLGRGPQSLRAGQRGSSNRRFGILAERIPAVKTRGGHASCQERGEEAAARATAREIAPGHGGPTSLREPAPVRGPCPG